MLTVPLVFSVAAVIVSSLCSVDWPAPPSDAVSVSDDTPAVPEKFTPMHAVVADEPGCRFVTLNIAVPVDVVEPPDPPWLSCRRIVFVANEFALLASVTVQTDHEPIVAADTIRPSNNSESASLRP